LRCRPHYLKAALEFLKVHNPDFAHIEISDQNLQSHSEETIRNDDIIDTQYSNQIQAQQDSYVPAEISDDVVTHEGDGNDRIDIHMTSSMIGAESNEAEEQINARVLASLIPNGAMTIPGGRKLLNLWHDFSTVRKLAWDVFPYGCGDYENAKRHGT
jgi:hypothetical protein